MKPSGVALACALVAVALVVAGTFEPILTLIVAAAVIAVVVASYVPAAFVTTLFVGGALLIDFSALAVYRYFLLSDLLLLAAWGLQVASDRHVTVAVPALLLLLGVAYLAGLLMAFGVSQDLGGLRNWLHFAFLILLYLPALTSLFTRRPDLLVWLAPAVVIAAFTQALILIAQVANGLEWRVGTRIPGALGSVGLWPYVAAVAALAGMMSVGRWPLKLASFLGLAVIALAEMFLRSRMVWMGSVLSACLMLAIHSGRWLRGVAVAAAITGLATVAYTSDWYPAAIQRRIAETLRPTETSDLVARMQVVRDLIGSLEDTGGVGVGIGASERYLQEHHSTSLVVAIHNVVMHAGVEGGILAAIAIAMIPIALAVLWRSASDRTGGSSLRQFVLDWAVSSLAAIFISAQLTPTLFEHTFYLLAAALASLSAVVPGHLTFERMDRKWQSTVASA